MYEGRCNGCGICCAGYAHHPKLGLVRAQCENLVVLYELGNSGATACLVHDKCYEGMPTRMIVPGTQLSYESECLPSYPRKQDAIPPECSYEWKGEGAQPKWSMGYAPELVQITEKQ